MKRSLILALSLLVISACEAPTAPKPAPTTVVATDPIGEIHKLALTSECLKTNWANRGHAPAGFIAGLALSYAHQACRLRQGDAMAALLSKTIGHQDALAIYGFTSVSADTATPELRLKTIYQLAFGAGMRESSGNWCTGRDASASNTEASTAEAGLFQTSYNSMAERSQENYPEFMAARPTLLKLYADTKKDGARCALDVYKIGSGCGAVSHHSGAGEGVLFQDLSKLCPEFSTLQSLGVMRVLPIHYGPVKRKEAQLVPACRALLDGVDQIVAQFGACNFL